MLLYLYAEIDSEGIINQMQRVMSAETKMRQEMDKLKEMLMTAKIKETGNSEEAPEKEMVIDGEIVSAIVQKAIHDAISKDVVSSKISERR